MKLIVTTQYRQTHVGFRLGGSWSVQDIAQLAATARKAVALSATRRALVDLSHVNGAQSPEELEIACAHLGDRLADLAKVAIVLRFDASLGAAVQHDRERYAVFYTELEARAWLKGSPSRSSWKQPASRGALGFARAFFAN